MNDDRCIQVGMLSGGMFEKYESNSRVYSSNGISPTLNTCGGGHREVKILEEPSGFYSNTSEDFFNQPLKGLARTLKANQHDSCVVEPYICASRGRNPDNPSDRTAGAETKQSLEINEQGTINTLTSVQKDNLVVEPIALDEQNKSFRYDGTVGTLTTDGSTPKHNNRVVEPNVNVIGNYHNSNHEASRIVDSESIYPTVKENHGTIPATIEKPSFRIRKLTPLGCIRLMDFDDSDYDKIKAVGMSDSQIYKQCGNSIVVACLEGIFRKMFIDTEVENEQLSFF